MGDRSSWSIGLRQAGTWRRPKRPFSFKRQGQAQPTRTKSTYLDVLLGILKVFEESIFGPSDSTLLVRSRVGVSVGEARLTTKETVEIRALLVRSSLFNGMALRALGLEDLGSLLFVSVSHGL
jgi:hypothetical protein